MLSVTVVGAGYFGQFHLDAWTRIANAKLSTIVEADQTKHQALAEKFPQASIVSDLTQVNQHTDIVDIVIPPTGHVAQIEKALKHTNALIICQKPFCQSIADAEKITAKAAAQNRTLVVHENFRFQPWYKKIKSLLNEQLLGDVHQARFCLRTGDGQGPRAYLDRQPYFQQMPKLLIHETGIHFIDVFRYLFGEPDSVAADLRQLNPHIAGEDAGHFMFRYNNGLRAMFDGNRHLDHAAENTRLTLGEMLIEGTSGTIQLTGDGEIKHRAFGSTQWQLIPYPRNDEGFAADCVYHLQTHIVDHLLKGTTLQNAASDYLQNLRMEQAVYEAAMTQQTVAWNQE